MGKKNVSAIISGMGVALAIVQALGAKSEEKGGTDKDIHLYINSPGGVVTADGHEAWVPGVKRLPVAWYEPGAVGYLSVSANEVSGWTSRP